MRTHRYRITVEPLSAADDISVQKLQPLQFEVENHDDILAIAARINQRGDLGTDATAFAIGLKLFSEAMLHHRDNPLFANFRPHFKDFMKRLKTGASATESPTQ
ncbi:DUF3861 domain-containing protein [Cellvibrio sp. PSBB023]|uniref:DUF3861 domain-containing protein n=1 Tax=Cellvibrio sp. PSBB023 TaxID=1945512 RepID=UPI00098F1565|nr:DUF3861 domain-containing protein [Cellvibrio sp. PSBB023]AQT61142.1 hypothetical protein B0D95_14330 [Cellvibrio sp. PSBB023]